VVSIGETKNAYKILLQKPLGELKRSLKDNIEMNLRKVGYEDGRRVQWTAAALGVLNIKGLAPLG
jgi:hypothetical protein